MNKVYIVRGQSGSRSNEDNSDWNVKAFTNQAKAESFAGRLNRRSARLYKAHRLWESERQDAHPTCKSADTKYFANYGYVKPDTLDPAREWAWERPSYSVEELELC